MYTFANILGNERLISFLKSAADRPSHAYILEGEAGLGKKTLAFTFAKLLQCESKNADGEPCHACKSCLSLESGNNPDVITITHKNKSIGVDDVREQIKREIGLRPYLSRYKIFVIPNCDLMTAQAQNALLKSLEEPPSYGIFLLTASNTELLLPTILSRSVVLRARPLADEVLANYLTRELGAEADGARFLSVYSGGNLGKAARLRTDEGFGALREKTLAILDGLHKKSLNRIFAEAKSLEENKEQIQDFLAIASLWYRDLSVLSEGLDEAVTERDISERLKGNRDFPRHRLSSALAAITKARRALGFNASFQLTCEILLLRLAGRL